MNLKIGDLARRANCPAETIRYYEREGLLAVPDRSDGNYRLYGRAHLERLSFIRNCRSLDMSLDEIRQLLRLFDRPQDDCSAAHALLDEHIAHVALRIAELQGLEAQLNGLRLQCGPAHAADGCGILNELGHDGAGASNAKPLPHVRGSHHAHSRRG